MFLGITHDLAVYSHWRSTTAATERSNRVAIYHLEDDANGGPVEAAQAQNPVHDKGGLAGRRFAACTTPEQLRPPGGDDPAPASRIH